MRYSYILNSLFCQLFGGSILTAWLPVDSPSSYHSLLECSCVIERESGFPLRIPLVFLSRFVDVMLSELHMIQLYREAQPAHTALFCLAIEIRWPRFSCWLCIHLTISLAPTSEQMRLKAALLRTWFSCRILNSDNQQKFMSWMKKKNDERISFWHLKSKQWIID